MTTIVGIFDNARDLDQAVERLAEAGIEDTVFDEARTDRQRAEQVIQILRGCRASRVNRHG